MFSLFFPNVTQEFLEILERFPQAFEKVHDSKALKNDVWILLDICKKIETAYTEHAVNWYYYTIVTV